MRRGDEVDKRVAAVIAAAGRDKPAISGGQYLRCVEHGVEFAGLAVNDDALALLRGKLEYVVPVVVGRGMNGGIHRNGLCRRWLVVRFFLQNFRESVRNGKQPWTADAPFADNANV